MRTYKTKLVEHKITEKVFCERCKEEIPMDNLSTWEVVIIETKEVGGYMVSGSHLYADDLCEGCIRELMNILSENGFVIVDGGHVIRD